MRPLTSYIELLLMTRHYAFVPGLGGFMFQEEPSQQMLGGRLMPPLRILKFNRFMDHNDGMLANLLMRGENLSFDEAQQVIRLTVSHIMGTIQREGRCALGRLGYLYTDEECHISFRASDQQAQDPIYYGMSQLNLQSWRSIEANRNPQPTTLPDNESATLNEPRKSAFRHHDGIVELPVRWIRRAAIILLVLCFIVGNMLPWGKSDQNQAHLANVVDAGCLIQRFNALEPQQWALVGGNLQETVDAPAVATPVLPAKSHTSAPAVTQNAKQYIVIVGSCMSQDEADRMVRRFERKGYTGLQIFERNGRFRLYINMFAHKDEAVTYLYKLRETPLFSDAWVLSVRSEELSLSYNIKNNDNDQLPMELLHLNNTAERDQG